MVAPPACATFWSAALEAGTLQQTLGPGPWTLVERRCLLPCFEGPRSVRGAMQAAQVGDSGPARSPEKLKKRLSPGRAPCTSHWICSHMLRRVGQNPGAWSSVRMRMSCSWKPRRLISRNLRHLASLMQPAPHGGGDHQPSSLGRSRPECTIDDIAFRPLQSALRTPIQSLEIASSGGALPPSCCRVLK